MTLIRTTKEVMTKDLSSNTLALLALHILNIQRDTLGSTAQDFPTKNMMLTRTTTSSIVSMIAKKILLWHWTT